MKKQYSKPNMKCVKLRGAEQLMAASGDQWGINGNGEYKAYNIRWQRWRNPE